MPATPLFVAPSGETLSERTKRVAQAQAAFRQIRVDYPPQTEVIACLDEVRHATKLRPKGAACGGARLVAPFGTGKTEAVLQLRAHAQRGAPAETTPVLIVEIDSQGSADSVPSSILKALEVARPDYGTERVRWERAVSELRIAQVEMLVFDEFNRAAKRPTMSRPIATSIRQKIMDAGVAPVVFVGSEEAATVFAQVPELMSRLQNQVFLERLSWTEPIDRELYLSFVDDLDSAIAERGLLAGKSYLVREHIARPLCEATAGRVRLISMVIEHAMSSAVREGRGFIETADLANAVDDLCVPDRFCTRNPFRGGDS